MTQPYSFISYTHINFCPFLSAVVPEVSLFPSTTTIRIGPQYNLTIYCNVDRGYPTEYTYYWTLHTQDSQNINLYWVQGSAYSLYGIGESDLGIYSCVVENSAGRSNPGVLQVQEGTIIGPVPSGMHTYVA